MIERSRTLIQRAHLTRTEMLICKVLLKSKSKGPRIQTIIAEFEEETSFLAAAKLPKALVDKIISVGVELER